MAIIKGWLPPTRENWEILNFGFGLFSLISVFLWLGLVPCMGKNSKESRLNLPGKLCWCVMEVPTWISLWYTMLSLQKQNGLESLPKANWLLAGLFTMHYIYRSVLYPLVLAPSMAPIHLAAGFFAFFFNLVNGTCIGAWLSGYGPTTAQEWADRMIYLQIGVVLFLCGFIGNVYHDDELRELRRSSKREQEEKQRAQGESDKKSVERVYKIPQAGLFEYILYPHYVCEWIEWTGFWIIGGRTFVPARNFVLNEVATMLPQAVLGKRWYIKRFGAEKIGRRKAVIPGLL